MQSKQPIGIFDSGIGGLSVLKEINKLLPSENLLYIADSAYAPYGNKSHEFILQRCKELTRFLIEQGAKAIVIACNTATAVAVTKLREQFTLPIIAMEPGVKPAIAATKSGIVGVLATENTLASEQFTNLVRRYAMDLKVISQPCPGLVEQIETGRFNSSETSQLIKQYVSPLLTAGADTIVLGCTHYPLVVEQIRQIVGKTTAIIETGQAVAQQLKRQLVEQHLLSDETRQASFNCWTSGNIDQLNFIVERIFDQRLSTRPLPEATALQDTNQG